MITSSLLRRIIKSSSTTTTTTTNNNNLYQYYYYCCRRINNNNNNNYNNIICRQRVRRRQQNTNVIINFVLVYFLIVVVVVVVVVVTTTKPTTTTIATVHAYMNLPVSFIARRTKKLLLYPPFRTGLPPRDPNQLLLRHYRTILFQQNYRSSRKLTCSTSTTTPPRATTTTTILATTTTTSTTTTMSEENNNNDTVLGQADIGKQVAQDEEEEQQQKQQQLLTEDLEEGDIDNINNNNNNMDIKSWRELIEISNIKSRKIRGSNYVQIATIDPITNEPRCRTVVFRGFLTLNETQQVFPESYIKHINLSCVIKIITDERSNKVNEIINNNNTKNNNNKNTIELVWWFPKTSEQYRIRGQVQFIGGKGMYQYDTNPTMIITRKNQWGNISDSARESFYDILNIPGQPYSEHPVAIPVGGRDINNNNAVIQPPPDNFLLLLILPTYCDYLRLTNMYRQIDTYEDGKWISKRVNP